MAAKSRSKRRKAAGSRPRARPQDPDILDVAGCAQALGFSAKYVRQLARQGKLPAVKFGNTWRFSRANIRATVESSGQVGSIQKVMAQKGVRVTVKK